ncbi:MAG: O-antigen ligase family protein [Pseudomonadota bacterium]
MQKKVQQFSDFLLFLLPFLAMSDRAFSFSVGGFNVRYAQILLLFLILVLAPKHLASLKSNAALKALAFLVIPQMLLLGTRTLPQLTALKLLWICFNIGGVILLMQVTSANQKSILFKGIIFSVLANSVILIIDWAAIAYGTGLPVIGFAQPAYGVVWYRPHAFYYEPSFVSSVLALSIPFLSTQQKGWLLSGLLLCVLFLVGARTGLLFAVIYLLLSLVLNTKSRLVIIKSVSLCFLLISILWLMPNTQNHFSLLFNILGPAESVSRASEKTSSEGGRIQNVLEELKIWRKAPVFGAGITQRGGERHGLDPLAINCWAEVLSEWGLWGLCSVLWLFMILFRGASLIDSKIAIFVHALVNLNFTQTLPRLDFWILLFALMYLGRESSQAKVI